MVPTSADVFIGTVFTLENAHSKLIPESVFRDFLEDVYLGVRYTESSLLNILVQVAFGALRCWMFKMPKRAPGQAISEVIKRNPTGIRAEHVEQFEAEWQHFLEYFDRVGCIQV